jgi:hypothetical protein
MDACRTSPPTDALDHATRDLPYTLDQITGDWLQ